MDSRSPPGYAHRSAKYPLRSPPSSPKCPCARRPLPPLLRRPASPPLHALRAAQTSCPSADLHYATQTHSSIPCPTIQPSHEYPPSADSLHHVAKTMDLDINSSSAAGILTLLAFRGVGPRGTQLLATRFPTLRDIRDSSPGLTAKVVSSRAALELRDESAWKLALYRSQAIVDEARHSGVHVLTPSDNDYPAWLREVSDRPPIVYVKGTLLPSRRYVACVGTREPSRFGNLATQRITTHLVENNWSIVSGLAVGVDTLAHQAALAAHGHTVAVLANGLDTIYPKANQALAQRILAAGGALLSEQPFGTPAIPRNLINRDRLQSGMSAGTVAMQTDILGGTMHTVRFTLLHGRQLFAPVPSGSHANEPKSRGLVALTQKLGPDLTSILKARGEYRDILLTRHRDHPPASPIHGREDYADLLRRLRRALPAPPNLDNPGLDLPLQSV